MGWIKPVGHSLQTPELTGSKCSKPHYSVEFQVALAGCVLSEYHIKAPGSKVNEAVAFPKDHTT